VDDGDEDARRRAMACHLVGDDLASLAASLRQIRGRLSARGPEHRQLDAALAVADRATRTLQRIGAGEPPRREPTRLLEMTEQIVQSHDPDRRRLVVEITPVVANVDGVRLERVLDRLVAIATAHAAPGTTIRLSGGPDGDSLRFSVHFDGREAATSYTQACNDPHATGDWPALVQLIDDLQGELTVGDTGTDIIVAVPRTDPGR
jgi:signal transduction histidine kinase